MLPCTQCQKSQRCCRYVAEGEPGSLSDASDVDTPDRASKRSRASQNFDGPLRGSRSESRENTALLEDHGARIERLERIILEKNSPFTEASNNSWLQRPVASSPTQHGLTVKDGSRTRFFGPGSTRVLVNLVSCSLHYLVVSHSFCDTDSFRHSLMKQRSFCSGRVIRVKLFTCSGLFKRSIRLCRRSTAKLYARSEYSWTR